MIILQFNSHLYIIERIISIYYTAINYTDSKIVELVIST